MFLWMSNSSIQFFRKKILWALAKSMRAACLAHPKRFLFRYRIYDQSNVVISCAFFIKRTFKLRICMVQHFLKSNSTRSWERYVMFQINSFIGLLLLKYQTISIFLLLLHITWLKSRNIDSHLQKLQEPLVLFTPLTQRPVTHHHSYKNDDSLSASVQHAAMHELRSSS